jgi:hypothetical protein
MSKFADVDSSSLLWASSSRIPRACQDPSHRAWDDGVFKCLPTSRRGRRAYLFRMRRSKS